MDLDALETSFDLVAPRGDELMEIFYARPVRGRAGGAAAVRRHRHGPPAAMLLAALVLLRNSLRDLDAVGADAAQARRPPRRLRRAGRRTTPSSAHVLIGAMAEVAGDAWEPRYAEAWGEAFGVVAGAMLEGAAEAELAARRVNPRGCASAGRVAATAMLAPSPPSASRLLRVEHAVAEALLEAPTPEAAFPRAARRGRRRARLALRRRLAAGGERRVALRRDVDGGRPKRWSASPRPRGRSRSRPARACPGGCRRAGGRRGSPDVDRRHELPARGATPPRPACTPRSRSRCGARRRSDRVPHRPRRGSPTRT